MKPIRTITVGRGRYRTIADIYPLQPNTRVVIRRGVYNEQLLLASDCQFVLEDGAVIDYGVDNYLPTVSVGSQQVLNCSITGGTIKRSGANQSANVVLVDNDSDVVIKSNIIGEGQPYPVAVKLMSGSLDFNGSITAFGPCIQTNGGNLTAVGTFASLNNYCIWISGNDTHADVKGTVFCKENSALALYNGVLVFEGTAVSEKLFGLEMGGGWSGTMKNSYFESKANGGKEVGDAISKYGGLDLTLDNCTMKCFHPSAYSISEQGRADKVFLTSDCFANRPASPIITLIGQGKLILE
jgi:hypothetical protein